MFDPREAVRLLKQDWATPTELARELYSMLTGKGAPEPPGSREPKAVAGAPSLPDAKRPATPRQARANSTYQQVRKSVAAASGSSRFATSASDISPGFKPQLHARMSFDRPKPFVDTRPETTEESHFDGTEPSSVEFLSALDGPSFSPARSSQVQTGPGTAALPGPAGSAATSSVSSGHVSPARISGGGSGPGVGASGLARAGSIQIDQRPFDYQLPNDQYDEYNYEGDVTRIPSNDSAGNPIYFGEVVSGTGNSYQCTLYDYPGTLTTDYDGNQTVTIWKINSQATLPPGSPLFPVYLADDGNLYAQPPIWLGGFGA